jgi:hypothetical protein
MPQQSRYQALRYTCLLELVRHGMSETVKVLTLFTVSKANLGAIIGKPARRVGCKPMTLMKTQLREYSLMASVLETIDVGQEAQLLEFWMYGNQTLGRRVLQLLARFRL